MITKIEIDGFKIYLRQDGTRGGKPSRADEVEQTVLSGVANTEFPHAFAMREEMRSWKRLQLNPVKLRKPSPILAKDFIGAYGSNLPAALARMKAEDLYVIKDIDLQHKGVLCFEEPENGIHPFRLENMSTLLRELATDFENEEEQDIPLRQVIINTHSPVLVGNFKKKS